MKYNVVWSEDATADFMELWSSSTDKAAVTISARSINQLLEREPLDEMHEVFGGFGTVIRGPIGVDFWIDDSTDKVYVTTVWPVSEDT